MSIQALREQRAAKATAANELAHSKDYNAPAFDALIDEINSLDGQIKRIEQANEEQVRCRSVHSSSVGGVGGVRARVCLHACTFAGVRMCGCAGCVHVRG